ncbi:MAG TPA: hypothetical protein VNW46_00390 [Gemmatimonadaceae bacterium]|jgi:hypothetical protein|nr:hypothetical protein [Gemmatimonadaceae bacterium]
MFQRQTIARVVLGALIIVCVLWCGRTGVRGYHLVTTLHALAINAIRLESVDTALAPGSRVEWDSATVATVKSRAWLRAADGHERYDSAANRRWEALLSPIERDSARLGARRGRPIQDVPGISDAVRVLTGPAPAALYVAELAPAADTTRLQREAATLFAVVDSGSPVVVHIRAGRPAGAARGELVMALPTVILPVY